MGFWYGLRQPFCSFLFQADGFCDIKFGNSCR